MAPHIVGNERGVSPVLPNRASIVSVDSILPDARDSSLSTTEAKTKAIADIVAEGNATAEKEKQETDARATQARVEASVVEEREVEEVAKQRAADKVARAARAPSAEEQVAKQRAADKAAREAARLSSANAVAAGSSWFLSKISQAAAEMAAALPPKDESSASSKSTTLHGSDASAKPPGKENQEAPRAFEYQARTSISSLVTETGEGRTHASTYLGADDSLLRHDKYFFNDGNITFLVDGTLYCIHRYFFSRDSEYFSTRFSQLGIRDHEALPTIISLGDIESRDFEAFLSVIYPENFEKHGLCYKEWVSVLHLSTRWGFASLRKLALASINPPTPHDQLLLARRYSIDDWVLPALSSLCERTAPLRMDEARQMNIEDVVIVATVRENIRNCTLRVNVAEIPRRVEAAQVGRLSSFEDLDVPPARPEAPPFSGGAAPSIKTGTPCFAGVAIPSTKPATPKFGGSPVPSTTTVTPCFAGVATPSPVPETPGSVPSPRPMTPKFGDVTSPSPNPVIPRSGDVALPPSRPVTPKLGDAAIPSPGLATFGAFVSAFPSNTTGTSCFGSVANPSTRTRGNWGGFASGSADGPTDEWAAGKKKKGKKMPA